MLGMVCPLAGCGGGGSSDSSPTPTPINKTVTFHVTWAPRTRGFNAGSVNSAQSAMLTFYENGIRTNPPRLLCAPTVTRETILTPPHLRPSATRSMRANPVSSMRSFMPTRIKSVPWLLMSLQPLQSIEVPVCFRKHSRFLVRLPRSHFL